MRAFVFWLSLPWLLGCHREAPEWNLFPDPPAAMKISMNVPSSPPSSLMLAPGGLAQTPGAPHVLLSDGRRILLLDAAGQRILETALPQADNAETADSLPALFLEKRRELILLRHDALWKLPLAPGAEPAEWVKLPDSASCGAFRPPLENHLQKEADFGVDPANWRICLVLSDGAPGSNSRSMIRIAVDPETGNMQSECAAAEASRNPKPPLCVPAPRLGTALTVPHDPGDETSCAIIIDGVRVPLLPEDEESSGCRIHPEGGDASRRHFVWCITDSDEDYGSRTCVLVDRLRRKKLEPAIQLPPDIRIRFSPRGESVLAGDFLFFLQPDPVRVLPLEGRAATFL